MISYGLCRACNLCCKSWSSNFEANFEACVVPHYIVTFDSESFPLILIQVHPLSQRQGCRSGNCERAKNLELLRAKNFVIKKFIPEFQNKRFFFEFLKQLYTKRCIIHVQIIIGPEKGPKRANFAKRPRKGQKGLVGKWKGPDFRILAPKGQERQPC